MNGVCKTCNHVHNDDYVYAVSGVHIKKMCGNCGAYICFAPQPPENFIMPFGKYKGQTLTYIISNDKRYVDWFLMQDINPKIKDKMLRLMK